MKLNVRSLKELEEFEWTCDSKWDFLLTKEEEHENQLSLYQENASDLSGEVCSLYLRHINLENLGDLELFGLEVTLEKPIKLTHAEKSFVKSLEESIHLVRFPKSYHYLHSFYGEPSFDPEGVSQWDGNSCGSISTKIFKDIKFEFITAESKKSWSKKELLELEVI